MGATVRARFTTEPWTPLSDGRRPVQVEARYTVDLNEQDEILVSIHPTGRVSLHNAGWAVVMPPTKANVKALLKAAADLAAALENNHARA